MWIREFGTELHGDHGWFTTPRSPAKIKSNLVKNSKRSVDFSSGAQSFGSSISYTIAGLNREDVRVTGLWSTASHCPTVLRCWLFLVCCRLNCAFRCCFFQVIDYIIIIVNTIPQLVDVSKLGMLNRMPMTSPSVF
jgi:hypothetical protein